MILSGDDSVFLLSCWLRLCRAVLIAPLRFICLRPIANSAAWEVSRQFGDAILALLQV